MKTSPCNIDYFVIFNSPHMCQPILPFPALVNFHSIPKCLGFAQLVSPSKETNICRLCSTTRRRLSILNLVQHETTSQSANMPSSRTSDRKVEVSFTNWVLGGSLVSVTSTQSDTRRRRTSGRRVIITEVDSVCFAFSETSKQSSC